MRSFHRDCLAYKRNHGQTRKKQFYKELIIAEIYVRIWDWRQIYFNFSKMRRGFYAYLIKNVCTIENSIAIGGFQMRSPDAGEFLLFPKFRLFTPSFSPQFAWGVTRSPSKIHRWEYVVPGGGSPWCTEKHFNFIAKIIKFLRTFWKFY